MQPIPLVLTVLLMSKTEPETGGNRRKPLCVDLDGTLIHTDCLFETLVGAIRTSPLTLFRVPGWFLKGRPTLKSELAKRFLPDPKLLPWNKEVLEYVKRKKEGGHKTVLVTASDQKVAELISGHTQIFDEVAASDGKINLKSHRKAEYCQKQFGKGHFDYIGNESCDLAIWEPGGNAVLANEDTDLEG